MVGLTFSHARDVLLTTLLKVLDLHGLVDGVHYRLNKSQLEVEIFGKTKIFIKSAELADKLRGYTVSDVYIDESAYASEELFNILIGRMREVDDAQIHLTTSPRGFNWVYDLTKSDDCEYIKVSTFANPFLPTRYIQNMLKQYSSTFIKQELYADFINITTGIFKSSWIKPLSSNVDLVTKLHKGQVDGAIRFYDFGFTEGGDYTAGIKLAKIGNDYIILDIVRERKIYPQLKQVIFDTAKLDGIDVTIGLEKAGQQIAIINDLTRSPELSSYIKRDFAVSKYGHKAKRMLVLASAAENGQLYISDTCNHKTEFIRECDELTLDDSHANDDMVDACASAYLMLSNKSTLVQGKKTSIY